MSICLTVRIPVAAEVTKTESACFSFFVDNDSSLTSCAVLDTSRNTRRRVIPGNTPSEIGGVLIILFFIQKIFAEDVSVILLSEFKIRPSSVFFSSAKYLAITEFNLLLDFIVVSTSPLATRIFVVESVIAFS